MSRNISSEFEFFIAPLLEVKKVNYDLSLSENFDIILFTSKNGLRFFKKDFIKDRHLYLLLVAVRKSLQKGWDRKRY